MPSEETLIDAGVVGAEEWLALSEELLGGLVHALNNRVAALSACGELAILGDSQLLEDGVLATEIQRMQRTSALLELLPSRDRPAEALELAPVLDDALQLHAHHPRLRSIEGVVEWEGTISPVRAPRWALVRLLVLLVDAAKARAHDSRVDRFELTVSGDDESMRLWSRAQRPVTTYAAGMARLCGAALASEGDLLVLTLPSLQETRRRERRARDGA